jgi:hypothetical protein
MEMAGKARPVWLRQTEWWVLATFVAPVEAQVAAGQAAAASRHNGRGFGALLAGGLSLFAVAVDGYHPYAEDGGLYLAGVKRLLDPALYPHGAEFVLEPTRLSAFAPAVAEVVRLSHVGLQAVLLALHLASVWTTLYAAWMLAERCWNRREAQVGAVALLACWLALPVAGTALFLMDPYVTARSFSTPATVLALVGVLDFTGEEERQRRRGFLMWIASIVVAVVMHPLMAAYALGATAMLVCVRSARRTVRVWGTAGLAVGAVTLAAWLQWVAKPESADYVRIAMTRTYWFPAEWRWFELVGLVAPLAILAWVGWRVAAQSHISDARPFGKLRAGSGAPGFGTGQEALARMAVITGATAWVIAMLFARVGAATHLVARMQPLRAFQIVYLVMVMVMGAMLGERVLQRSAWRWAVALVALGGIMMGAEQASFPDTRHLELPGMVERNPWVQAFLWIRENTAKDALFALDADYIHAPEEDAQSFRAIAERSALPDYSKDGGESSIAPDLTGEWKMGQEAQRGLSSETDAERVAVLGSSGVTWVVLEAGATTSFECPYGNSAVKVCRLR